MSNLATMIMEGTSIGTTQLQRHYDHENGAGLIAMESAEALRDIFEATFYVPNTCTIAAAMEGYSSVEESATQSAIMEASVKGAFQKIKDFFIKLKDKVKEFFHNIKRYLTGIFGNDEKWAKNYEKELTAIKSDDLKGYKVKMYKYTIADVASKADISKSAEKLISETEQSINKLKAASHGMSEDDVDEDKIKEDRQKEYLEFIKNAVGKSIDEDELDKAIWSSQRDGADSDKDKEDVEVASNMKNMIAELKTSSKTISAYDTMISKTDSMYNKAIKCVADAEKQFDKLTPDDNGIKTEKTENGENMYGKGAQAHVTASLHALSAMISKEQTVANKIANAAKSAYVERNSAYKSALTGAFAYARKHKGGK